MVNFQLSKMLQPKWQTTEYTEEDSLPYVQFYKLLLQLREALEWYKNQHTFDWKQKDLFFRGISN